MECSLCCVASAHPLRYMFVCQVSGCLSFPPELYRTMALLVSLTCVVRFDILFNIALEIKLLHLILVSTDAKLSLLLTVSNFGVNSREQLHHVHQSCHTSESDLYWWNKSIVFHVRIIVALFRLCLGAFWTVKSWIIEDICNLSDTLIFSNKYSLRLWLVIVRL